MLNKYCFISHLKISIFSSNYSKRWRSGIEIRILLRLRITVNLVLSKNAQPALCDTHIISRHYDRQIIKELRAITAKIGPKNHNI